MHMDFQRNGVRGEAIVFAVSRARMRIAERGRADTVELTLQDGCWFDENGRRVEIDAMVGLNEAVFADFAPRTMTAS